MKSILLLLTAILSSCVSVKQSHPFSYDASMSIGKNFNQPACHVTVTITNLSKNKIRLKDGLQVFLFDKNQNQIGKAYARFNAVIFPSKSATAEKSYVGEGKESIVICNSVADYAFEW